MTIAQLSVTLYTVSQLQMVYLTSQVYVLYLAGIKNRENVTQGFIAKTAGITEVTLGNGMNDLKKHQS